jgi:hypothetical protein
MNLTMVRIALQSTDALSIMVDVVITAHLYVPTLDRTLSAVLAYLDTPLKSQFSAPTNAQFSIHV